ncbi:MAG: branched-chain amino acid ABC transporter permease [Candidatus Bathyarchaeia archaeon]
MIYILDGLAYTGIFAISALALNLQYGFTGLANFGHVAFFMVGAYATALAAAAGLPFPLCAFLSIAAASFMGIIASLPALRLREDYLAMTTIAFGEILRMIFKNEEWIAHGVWGIGVPSAIALGGGTREFYLLQLLLIFSVLALCLLLIRLVSNSPYGRVLRAVRDDSLAAEVYGKNVFGYKAQVFALGSGLAGLSGALFAQYVQYVNPYMFEPTLTFSMWIMVILGGVGNNMGVLLGALLIEFFERSARMAKDLRIMPMDPNNVRAIIVGILIIFVLLYRPGGLLKEEKVKTPAIKALKVAREGEGEEEGKERSRETPSVLAKLRERIKT